MLFAIVSLKSLRQFERSLVNGRQHMLPGGSYSEIICKLSLRVNKVYATHETA